MTSILRPFILIVMLSSAIFAQKWQPYQFKGNEKFDFKIENHDRNGVKQAFYSLQLKETGQQDEKGEPVYDVIYKTRAQLPKSKLGAETAFGVWNTYGVSLSLAFMNPMYGMIFSQMDLAVGEKMSFFGAGKVEVLDKVSIAGRSGFRCILKTTQGEEEVLTSEWVIDPDLAFPLKAITYNKGKVATVIEMTGYEGS